MNDRQITLDFGEFFSGRSLAGAIVQHIKQKLSLSIKTNKIEKKFGRNEKNRRQKCFFFKQTINK